MRKILLLCIFCSFFSLAVAQSPWSVVEGRIKTEWSAQVDPARTLQEFPRPQMQRETWVNLNGLWDYAITPKDRPDTPRTYEGKILVPFAVESALSGVGE